MKIWNRQHPGPGTVWRLFGAALLACLLIIGSMRAFFLLRAASLIYGLSTKPAPIVVRAYMKFFRHAIAESDFSVPGNNGPVPVRMIFPRDNPAAPIVVLVHGLAPQGYRDGLLSVLADRLARIGLCIVIPNLPAAQHRLMRPSDLDDIGSAVRWSAKRSGQRVAVFGISFGGGLAIATADMPQYSNLIKIVFSDAGYNSIERLGHYYIGDRVDRPNGQAYSESAPGSGPLLMAFQHLDEMVPADDVSAFNRLILSQALNHSGGPAPPDVLTPAQNRLYNDLRTAHSSAMRNKYHQLLERHQPEMRAISPRGHMAGLRAPLYILHGADDNSIPAGETLWTERETPSGAAVHALLTPWVAHAVLGGQVSLREKLRVGNFFSEVLNAAFRPSPL